MIDQIKIRGCEFPDIRPAQFGVLHLGPREAVPTVSLLTVDTATDDETVHEVRPGQPFHVAGQTWQVTEVPYLVDAEREVVLRRFPSGARNESEKGRRGREPPRIPRRTFFSLTMPQTPVITCGRPPGEGQGG
jgi:Family of unknown function (DUF6406)